MPLKSRVLFQRLLMQHNDNRTQASAAVGMSRRTFGRCLDGSIEPGAEVVERVRKTVLSRDKVKRTRDDKAEARKTSSVPPAERAARTLAKKKPEPHSAVARLVARRKAEKKRTQDAGLHPRQVGAASSQAGATGKGKSAKEKRREIVSDEVVPESSYLAVEREIPTEPNASGDSGQASATEMVSTPRTVACPDLVADQGAEVEVLYLTATFRARGDNMVPPGFPLIAVVASLDENALPGFLVARQSDGHAVLLSKRYTDTLSIQRLPEADATVVAYRARQQSQGDGLTAWFVPVTRNLDWHRGTAELTVTDISALLTGGTVDVPSSCGGDSGMRFRDHYAIIVAAPRIADLLLGPVTATSVSWRNRR